MPKQEVHLYLLSAQGGSLCTEEASQLFLEVQSLVDNKTKFELAGKMKTSDLFTRSLEFIEHAATHMKDKPKCTMGGPEGKYVLSQLRDVYIAIKTASARLQS